MSANGLDVFDKTLQTTHIWLDDIMKELGPDRQVAWHVLGSVLRAIRDRLPPDLAAHLGAQLPLLIRGAYSDRYRPSATPVTERTLDGFLTMVKADMEFTRPVDSSDAVRVVCDVIDRHIDPGQAVKVWDALPQDIRRVAHPEAAE